MPTKIKLRHNKTIRAFTLLELLIVIVILGILAGLVWKAIDPIDKINAANDSKVQSDLGSISQALESYATSHEGVFPISPDQLINSGELKQWPSPPGGYLSYALGNTVGTPRFQQVGGEVKSKKYTSVPDIKYWVRCSKINEATPSFSQSMCCKQADINKDGTVNILDLSYIGGRFGQTVNSGNEKADLNGDGIINNLDISLANEV